jgi:hypothetical protein
VKIFFIWVLIIVIAFSSCKKYSYYQSNPNEPSEALPSLLLTDICTDIFPYNFHTDGSAYASRYLTTYSGTLNAYVAYSWIQGSYGGYDVLRQVQQMDTLAAASGNEEYIGLAHFFRAVIFSQLTEMFGDVPYSQALQESAGNATPKYDTQEDVYVGVLDELEQANTIMADVASKGVTILGDVIYNGNASQWQKAINAFRLRLLIHLSKKTGDTRLNVAQQFQTIITNSATYPLMTSNSDNAQIVFNTTATSNYYPTYNNLAVESGVSMEKGFVDTLKTKNDPRLFSFAEPIPGRAANVFANYAGVDAGLSSTDQQNSVSVTSLINKRYSNSMVNEPIILIGYPEQEFLIAEAIAHGWISSGPGGTTAQDCYNAGITASMQFYNMYAAAGIDSSTIVNYLTQSNVAYNNSTAIQQIITQKYIALFLQSDFEPFVEQRRTGYPTFDVGPGTLNNEMVPKRWAYPTNEYQQNSVNVTTAVQSQYGGTDDVNQVMWLLK